MPPTALFKSKGSNTREHREASHLLQAHTPNGKRPSKHISPHTLQPKQVTGIQKMYDQKGCSGKDGRKGGGNISDILSHYANTIQTSMQKRLNDCEARHLDVLNDLSEAFDANLKLETRLMERIKRPIVDEEFQMTITSSGNLTELAVHETRKMKLAEEMDEFQKLVNDTEQELSQLWQLWTVTQSEILALGFELDEEGFPLMSNTYERGTIMYANAESAVQARRDYCEERKETYQRITAFERAATIHAAEIRKSNRDLQAQYALDMQGYLHRMGGLLAAL